MKLHLPTALQLALLSLCCVLISVRQSDGTFVPGRCLCPQTQPAVRGPLKNLTVFLSNPTCDKVTLIVTLCNGAEVCLDPEAPRGRQLIRCWKRAQKRGRDVKQCLRRRRRRRNARQGRQPGQGSPGRSRGQGSKSSLC